MFERRVECPQCRREIRLTEAELADKRGFCALCDARFDVLADMVTGGGPMREQVVPRVALALAPLPSERVAVESAAPDAAIVLRPRRSPRQPIVFLVWLVGMASWLACTRDGSELTWMFGGLQLMTGLSMVKRLVWTRAGRERVTVASGALRLERSIAGLRLRGASVALDGVVELKVLEPASFSGAHACTVTVASTTSPPVAVGHRLGLDATDADWLRNALAARLAAARP